MEVANAGMYDGATSLAEGVLMACRVTQRDRVVVLDTISPDYLAVIKTYCQAQGIQLSLSSTEKLEVNDETACLVAQYPNFYGYLEDVSSFSDLAHHNGALLVVSADPMALGMFKPPGSYDADIVTGEGQPLGIPTSFGGPYLGLFTTKQQYIRQMPSRLVGRTLDDQGRTGFVLTLQTREQHIRRERATSNICTNEALYALASTVYLSAMGKNGLRQISELCYHKAHYAASKIAELPGYKIPVSGTFFQEFVVECPVSPRDINQRLLKDNILGGLDLTPELNGDKGNQQFTEAMLFCITEMNSRDDIDSLVSVLGEFS